LIIFKIFLIKHNFKLKPINGVVLKGVFNAETLELIYKASTYNACNIGMFLRLCFPFSKFRIPEIKEVVEFEVALSSIATESSLKSKIWKAIYKELINNKKCEVKNLKIPSSELAKMTQKGLLELFKIEGKKQESSLRLTKNYRET
jgi:primosomal protein N'